MKKTLTFILAVMCLCLLYACTQKEGTQQEKENTSQTQEEVNSLQVNDQQIQDIQITINQGSLSICQGETLSFQYNDGKDIDYHIEDHTLTISQQLNKKATLTLPESTYSSLSLSMKNAHLYIEESIQLSKLQLDLKQGEANIQTKVSDESLIEVNQGTAYIVGDLGKDITITSKEGHVQVETSQSQKDYNYDLSVSDGKLSLDNQLYTGRTYTNHIDNNASMNMKLTCSKGDLSIRFQ